MTVRGCPDPQFTYDAARGWWNECSTCCRVAWEHAGSKPLEDVRAHAEWIRNGSHGRPPAPHVEPG